MNIAILYGGTSSEREASYQNAKAVAAALKKGGHQASLVPFDATAPERLRQNTDIVFVAVQGKHHGDGTCQSLCHFWGLPYTGTRAANAAIIINKSICKQLAPQAGLATPPFFTVTREEYDTLSLREIMYRVRRDIGFPAVAKGNTQGGSFGIVLLEKEEDAFLLEQVFALDDVVLLEQYVDGMFVTIGLLDTPGGCLPLPPVTAQNSNPEKLQLFTEHYRVQAANLPLHKQAELQDLAVQAYSLFGGRGYARVDFMLDKTTETPQFLEINAVPGLRPGSFFPAAAELVGYALPDVCQMILEREETDTHA